MQAEQLERLRDQLQQVIDLQQRVATHLLRGHSIGGRQALNQGGFVILQAHLQAILPAQLYDDVDAELRRYYNLNDEWRECYGTLNTDIADLMELFIGLANILLELDPL